MRWPMPIFIRIAKMRELFSPYHILAGREMVNIPKT